MIEKGAKGKRRGGDQNDGSIGFETTTVQEGSISVAIRLRGPARPKWSFRERDHVRNSKGEREKNKGGTVGENDLSEHFSARGGRGGDGYRPSRGRASPRYLQRSKRGGDAVLRTPWKER